MCLDFLSTFMFLGPFNRRIRSRPDGSSGRQSLWSCQSQSTSESECICRGKTFFPVPIHFSLYSLHCYIYCLICTSLKFNQWLRYCLGLLINPSMTAVLMTFMKVLPRVFIDYCCKNVKTWIGRISNLNTVKVFFVHNQVKFYTETWVNI